MGGPVYVVKSQIHAGGRGKGRFEGLGPDAKGGAAAFCRAAAAEVGRNGITVNCISLGTIPQAQWEMADGPSEVSEHRQRAVREYTLRRFGTPEDITGMVVLLASDRGSWITGQTIPVNGGFSFSL